MPHVDLRVDTASLELLYSHLRACDHSHVPPLSTRVNLQSYAAKVHAYAVRFEAWSDDGLVGLVAVYLNDPERRSGHITDVSVRPDYVGQGIAARLLEASIEEARRRGFGRLSLEVGGANDRAQRLYRRIGFKEEAGGLTEGPRYRLSLQL